MIKLLMKALFDLLKYITTDPRRYESRVPYLIPEVKAAMKADMNVMRQPEDKWLDAEEYYKEWRTK